MATYSSVNPDTAEQKIWGMLKPYDGLDYPLFDTEDQKGGARTTDKITSTNPPVSHRKAGMTVFQESDGSLYKLEDDLTTWTKKSHGTHNGLYEYTVYPTNGNGVDCEEYKWDNGRLEYYLQFPQKQTTNGTGNLYYMRHPHFTFPTPFTSTDWMNIQVSAINLDAPDRTSFAEFDDIQATMFRPVLLGTSYYAYGKLHAYVNGLWK